MAILAVLGFFTKFFGVFFIEILENCVKFFMPRKLKKINGKLALITGGGQGLGKALSTRLAAEGCNIAICDINLAASQATCDDIKQKFNVKAEAFKCDVRDTAQVLQLCNDIEEIFGCHVNILVNNAGILAPLGILEGRNEDIQRVIDVNLTAHFWVVRTFLPKMIENKDGHILGIASAAAKSASPFSVAYTASKFGLNGFYKSVFEDMKINDYDEFIKITVAMPGFIDTREDVVDLLKSMNDTLQRLKPSQAADIIVKAMLQNRREIFFPFQYKFGVFLDYVLPHRTSKLLIKTVAEINFKNKEQRLTMAMK